MSLEFFERHQASLRANGGRIREKMDFSPFGTPSRLQVKDLLSSEAPSAGAGPFLAVREHKRLGCPPARLSTPEYAWVPWSALEHPGVRFRTPERVCLSAP